MNSWLDIRPVPEDPELLRLSVTPEEWQAAAGMKPASRRAEWLAWRAAARERLGKDISITYDSNGAPRLEKGLGHIGVSHTRGWVAVVWSPRRCAVDIEHVSRKISHVSHKFISPEEAALADSANPLFEIAVWCAKEALYKYSGTSGLDLSDEIRITSSEIDAGRMTGSVCGSRPIDIEIILRGELVCAVIL